MRLKILMLGDDPTMLTVDAQVLKERNFLVYTAFNPDNMNEAIAEIKPDLVFFNPHHQNAPLTDAYNEFVNGIRFTKIPVIYTLSEDDVYLITRKRTESKDKRSIISDNMVDAIRMAMAGNKSPERKITEMPPPTMTAPTYSA